MRREWAETSVVVAPLSRIHTFPVAGPFPVVSAGFCCRKSPRATSQSHHARRDNLGPARTGQDVPGKRTVVRCSALHSTVRSGGDYRTRSNPTHTREPVCRLQRTVYPVNGRDQLTAIAGNPNAPRRAAIAPNASAHHAATAASEAPSPRSADAHAQRMVATSHRRAQDGTRRRHQESLATSPQGRRRQRLQAVLPKSYGNVLIERRRSPHRGSESRRVPRESGSGPLAHTLFVELCSGLFIPLGE